jgi:hypothetical protein
LTTITVYVLVRNELYDQSALRAVLESIPFPPLPRDFPGQYLKVNFGFNPGIDKG